jgi:hypothetical protein
VTATRFEASLTADRRRAGGVYFTPPEIAERLAAIALGGFGAGATICDPASGAAAMLLAAGRALAERGASPATIATHQLWGVERDADALAAARAAIVDWSGVDPGDHLVVGDGLRAGERWPARFDAVLGNPPFLNQLERATVRTDAVPPALAHVRRAYTDTAWLFLAAAPALVRPGGRVVLIQPQSVAAARDAGPVRAHLAAVAPIEGMWSCHELVFDAAVRVCAPVLRVGTGPASSIARWTGATVEPHSPGQLAGTTWSPLLVGPDPPPPLATHAGRRLGDIATATAGFRDEFYGLAPFVVDDADAPEATHPKLVTTALVEPGRLLWGERRVRFAGRAFTAPRIDLAALARQGDERVDRWVRARLLPKAVVATQTPVVEAAADIGGHVVPSTPVISVEGADPWLVAAALTAPPVSAWAVTHHGGTALSAGAVKLSARAVLDAPLPADEAAWQRGARLLARGELLAAADVLNGAHGASDDVLAWWARRARVAT